jgi:hypothetical protein
MSAGNDNKSRDTWFPAWNKSVNEIIENRTKLHTEELHNLYSLLNIIRITKSWRMIRAGYIACTGEKRDAYWDFARKPEGKRLRRRWNDNIKIVHSDTE